MRNIKFKNIIFDFDGTLIDSRPGVVISFKKVVKELASREIEDGEISKLIGSPLSKIVSVLLDTDDQAVISRGSELFKKYYNEDEIRLNVVYPGIEKMLITLKNQSCQLFVVSNKIELFMNKILKQHNFDKYFTLIRGTDGTDKKSRKAEYIKDFINQHNLEKAKTVVVGDTENDIIAAKENSIYSIGVTWGYGSKSSLIKAKADKICHTPLELEQFIKKNETRETT